MSTLRALLNLPTDLLSDLFSHDEQSALWFYQTFCWRGESSQVINMSSYSLQSLRTSTYERWFHSQLSGWGPENGNILKDFVINTKQIYRTYSAKRSQPADFTGSQLLWAVMVISMLFTPSALLFGHVSKTNSTSKFSKQVKKNTLSNTHRLLASILDGHFTEFLLNCLKAQPQMTTELILHPSRQIIYKHHKAGISSQGCYTESAFFQGQCEKNVQGS